MFHPDRYGHDPEKRETYQKLTQAINQAKDRGDFDLLERIAKDPQPFILSQGWVPIDFDEVNELRDLRALFEFLQNRILATIVLLDKLHSSAEHDLYDLVAEDEAVLEQVTETQREELGVELEKLRSEAHSRAEEIEELTGAVPF